MISMRMVIDINASVELRSDSIHGIRTESVPELSNHGRSAVVLPCVDERRCSGQIGQGQRGLVLRRNIRSLASQQNMLPVGMPDTILSSAAMLKPNAVVRA